MTVISALGRPRQEDHEFKASLSYTGRPSLKTASEAGTHEKILGRHEEARASHRMGGQQFRQKDTRTQRMRGHGSSVEGHGVVDSSQSGFGHVLTCVILGVNFSKPVSSTEQMDAARDVCFCWDG